MKKLVAIVLVVVMTLAMFAGCAKPKSNLDKINIAYHTNLGGAAIVMAAKHTGLFEKYGFEENLVGFTSGPVEVGAMGSGEIDFGYIGHGATTLAIGGKVDVLTFEKMGDDEAIYTSKSKGIKTLADLKGKKIGTTLGTSGETVLNAALKSVGLDPAKDVQIVNMDMGACVVAMVSEQIDAVCVFSQYKVSVEKGLGDKGVKLAKTSDFPTFATPSSWIVTPKYLENNHDKVVRFTALVLEASEYYKLHLEEVVQWCADFLEVPYDTLIGSAAGITIYTVEEYKARIADKTIENLYLTQQNNFLADGKIEGNVPVADYVRFDIIEEAFKLIESKK